MWWQFFILLVATAVASDEEYEDHRPDNDDEDYSTTCESVVFHECNLGDEAPKNFPGTDEELEEFCKSAKKYFQCSENILSTHDSCEDSFFKRYLRDTAQNVRRVCEDTLIRIAFVANLPCIEKNKDDIGSCHPPSYPDNVTFADTVKEIGITDIDESSRCLNILFISGCTAAMAGQHCGDAARDILVNILQGFDTPFELCPPDAKQHLLTIAEMIQAEAEKAESVKNTIKKKK